jgi:hypothetical protein
MAGHTHGVQVDGAVEAPKDDWLRPLVAILVSIIAVIADTLSVAVSNRPRCVQLLPRDIRLHDQPLQCDG